MRYGTLALGIVSSVIVSRALGPAGRGELATFANWAGLAVQLGNLGLASALTYATAQHPDRIQAIVRWSIRLSLSLGLAGAGTIAVLHMARPDLFGTLSSTLLYEYLASVPFALGFLFIQAIMLGRQDMLGYNTIDAINRVLLVFGFVIWIGRFAGGLPAAVHVTVAVQAGTMALSLWLIRRHSSRDSLEPQPLRPLMQYGLKSWLSTTFGYLLLRSDILMLNYYRGTTEVGQYSTAVQVADLLLIVPTTIGALVFSYVATGDGWGALSLNVVRAVAWVHGITCVVAGVFAYWAIVLLWGPAFAPAVPSLWILLPGVFFLGVNNPMNQDLAGRGNPWKTVLVWIPPLVLNVALNLLWIPSLGARGAALSSSVSYFLAVALMARLFLGATGGRWLDLIPRLTDFWFLTKQATSLIRLKGW